MLHSRSSYAKFLWGEHIRSYLLFISLYINNIIIKGFNNINFSENKLICLDIVSRY